MRSPNQRPVIAASRFRECDAGNVGIIFGLAFLPMLLMAGAAADYTHMTTMRSGLQQATDAAVLAVATKITATTTTTQAQAQAQVRLNAQSRMASAQITSVTISDDKKTFCANSRISVPTSFMKLTGVQTLNPTVAACANLAGGVDPNTTYEISLVLDNSGSMSGSAGGVSKMQALRTAATSFTNTMYSQVTPGKLQMSIAPFNAAVKVVDPVIAANRTLSWIDTAGNSSLHWNVFGGKTAANAQGFTSRFDIYTKLTARRSAWDWNGCFEPQPYPMDVNDTPPTSATPDTLFVPYLAPDEPSFSGYPNSYFGDDFGACTDTASGDWAKLNRACKYNITATTPAIDTSKGPDGVCSGNSSQILMPLTSTQTTVTTKIRNLQEGGWTNVHEGFMWGWRTISPNAPFAASRAYNTVNNRKVMVFMTDGYNNWNSRPGKVGGSDYQAPGYYSLNGAVNTRLPDGTRGNGVNYQTQLAAAAPNNSTDFHDNSRNALDELTLEACTNAKAQGIEIFTIGFSTPDDPIDTQGLNLMKNCATNVEHYFAAANADQLNAAFTQIGIGLGKLRLSK